jgi:hypothetical protein
LVFDFGFQKADIFFESLLFSTVGIELCGEEGYAGQAKIAESKKKGESRRQETGDRRCSLLDSGQWTTDRESKAKSKK